MTAHLASIGPVGWAAIVVGSWLVLTFGLGRGVGRAIVIADEAMAEEVPPLLVADEDADWLAAWPGDTPISVIEAAYYDKEFLSMPLVADDLRRSA